ncbi:putative sulfoacetate transporter SauU [Oxobacter pfennigii]|uniref:Putative sulfoacetate transporter SauU n=1 Tax=Oxobacter pfennigii TaxID=36849 RepID=A0A0P8Y9Z6_9CLOT|nr:MFS transporter [Oxobacter pfennigii]KPU43755.1 putative sulfoacetate transporter SauU [Oxobacter pfennigii]
MAELKISSQNDEQSSWYGWIVAVLCLSTFAVSFAARQLWSASIASASPELGISMAQAGGLVSAFYVGNVSGGFFAGVFIDNFGPRKCLSISGIIIAICMFLVSLTHSYTVIFLLMVLAGLASSPVYSGTVKMNLGWFTDKVRGTAMGFIMTGPAVGGLIVNAFYAPFIKNHGWRNAYVLAAAACLVVGVIVFFMAKEKGIALANKTGKKKTSEERAVNMKGTLKVLFSGQFFLGTIVQFLGINAGTGYTTWAIVYFMKVRNFSLTQAGGILAAAGVVTIFSTTLCGMLSDLLKSRRNLAMVGYTIQAVCIVVLAIAPDVRLLWATVLVRGLTGGLGGNSNNVMQAERAKGPYVGTVMGMYNALCQLGSVIAPVLFGIVLDITGSYFVILMSIAALYFTQAICTFFLKETLQVAKQAS